MITTILQQTFIITTFVLGMMMVIEYFNIQTRGLWSKKIQKSPFAQILLGTIMGIIPGCLGAYTMVSLYIHRVVMFPAIIATMIATSGDEAFLMFSIMPATAIKLHIILFILALISGVIVHFTVKNKYIGLKEHAKFPIHKHDTECHPAGFSSIKHNLKHMSFTRALLITGTISILFLLMSGIIDGEHHLNTLMGNNSEHMLAHESGDHHHAEADWIRYILIGLFSIILIMVTAAADHFLHEHLWQHIIKKHFLKIFLWTLGVLILIYVLNSYIDLTHWISANIWMVLVIALLIGIIPESGPHFIFVILFTQGVLPFSILLANSIAQDGHGSLPLLAESQKSFIAVKALSLLVASIVGASGLLMGW